MKLGIYQPLDEADLRNLFLRYVDALNIPIIDYVAIGFQDTVRNNSTSLMSRVEWQRAFSSQNLANHDPVRRATFNTNVRVFAFDEIDHGDHEGIEVMRQRKIYGIENGIVIVRRNFGYNFMLTLATGYKNFKAYKFLLEHRLPINLIYDDLIKIISQSSKNLHLKNINYLFDDAKLLEQPI